MVLPHILVTESQQVSAGGGDGEHNAVPSVFSELAWLRGTGEGDRETGERQDRVRGKG